MSSWSSRSKPVATVLLAAVLSVAAGAAVDRAQRATSRKPAGPPARLALEIADYAALPITGLPDGTGNNAGSLARINVMRQEPGPAGRFFINDLTGPLYIVDPRTRADDDLSGLQRPRFRTGLFDKLTTEAGLASGFISFEFDPGLRPQRPLLHDSSRGDGAARNAGPGQSRISRTRISPATRPPRRSRHPELSTMKAC